MYAMIFISLLFTFIFVARNTQTSAADLSDTVSSGNYLIRLCNSSDPDSAASYLQDLLPQIYVNLQAVIADTQLGTASKRGYGAFFKTNDNIQDVMRVYEAMAAGPDILIQSVPGRQFPAPLAARPTFICINDIYETEAIYHQCINDHPNIPSVTWDNTRVIALCPLFWDQKQVPLARTDCPRLKGNTLSPNKMQLSENQEAMIIYQLAHLYGNVTRWQNSIMNVQDAVDLNASASLENANNYALYYAAVQAGCKKWPKSDGRDLLEIPASVSEVVPSITPSQSTVETFTSVDPEPATGSANPFVLQTRQSSCLNWLEAPNSTVCCDESSGEWIEAPIQRDTVAADPKCPTVVVGIGQDGGPVVSNTQTAPAPAQTTFSSAQQNYCYGEMRLPNSTVCCDMSSGLWKPAPVIRDTEDTTLVSAACPTIDYKSGGSEYINT